MKYSSIFIPMNMTIIICMEHCQELRSVLVTKAKKSEIKNSDGDHNTAVSGNSPS